MISEAKSLLSLSPCPSFPNPPSHAHTQPFFRATFGLASRASIGDVTDGGERKPLIRGSLMPSQLRSLTLGKRSFGMVQRPFTRKIDSFDDVKLAMIITWDSLPVLPAVALLEAV